MRGFGLQRQRPVADQLRIAAVLLRKIGRWMPQYASGIDSTKCRIVFDGDVYNIVSIDHMNFKKKSLKFKCEKERQK